MNASKFGLCNQCEDDYYGDQRLDPSYRDFEGMEAFRVHCFACHGRHVNSRGECVDSGCANHHAAVVSTWTRVKKWLLNR